LGAHILYNIINFPIIYSAGKYDEVFIKKIVGFGETSKYSSNTGLQTADELCKKIENKD
jgi:hypothetical protein